MNAVKRGQDRIPTEHLPTAAHVPLRTGTRSGVDAPLVAENFRLRKGLGSVAHELVQNRANKAQACRQVQALQTELRCKQTEIKELSEALAAAAATSAAAATAAAPARARAAIASAAAAAAATAAAAAAPADPQIREYKSESSKGRAASKLRRFLRLYPAESQADLVARAVVVDGRGKKCGISVGLVKELLANP